MKSLEFFICCVIIANMLLAIGAIVIADNYDKANFFMQISVLNYISLAWSDIEHKINKKT